MAGDIPHIFAVWDMMPGMNDQPTNDQPTSSEPTDHDHGRDQPSTDQSTDHTITSAWVTMEQAAEQLGITVNAVRQRIKRETLIAVKTDEGWLVDMSATDHRPGANRPTTTVADQPTSHETIPTDQQPTIDLAPLAELIERQAQDLQRLTETATMWQVRAIQAEERLKQLEATVNRDSDEATARPETVPEGAQAKTYRAPTDTGTAGLLERLRRWIRGTE